MNRWRTTETAVTRAQKATMTTSVAIAPRAADSGAPKPRASAMAPAQRATADTSVGAVAPTVAAVGLAPTMMGLALAAACPRASQAAQWSMIACVNRGLI